MYFAWDALGDKGENIANWENIIRLGYIPSDSTSKSFNLPPPANESFLANQNTFAARVFFASSAYNYDYLTEATQSGGGTKCYLHTNFKPQEGKTIITVDCEYPSIASDVYLFGCYNDKYSMAAYFNSSKEWALACNDNNPVWNSTTYVGVKNERVLVTLDATGVNATTGSVTVARTGEKYLAINSSPHTKTGAATSYNFLFLWGRSTGANVNQKSSTAIIYSCTITNAGVCVRDFRPAVKDGIAGMWDGVNNVFYKSAGTTPMVQIGTNKTYFVAEGDVQSSVSKSWKKQTITDYTYTGAAGDGLLTNPENYQGNIAPNLSDGLSNIIIGEGVESLTITDEISVYGIVFDSKASSSLIAGNGNAKINLGRGGVTTRNQDAAETITYTLNVPIYFSSCPQEWTINASTILDLQSPISTLKFEDSTFTISSLGQVKFSVDNPDMTIPLFITGVTANTRPHIYKPKSLGSPSRTVTITGSAPPLFITANAILTNEVPISIPSNGSVDLNSSANYPLHFSELVTVSSSSDSSIKIIAGDTSRVYFHRGIKNLTSSIDLKFDANVTIEDTLSTPNIIRLQGQRNIYLATTNNSYNTINPYRANIVCMTNNVFNKNATIEMGTSGSNYRKAGASIDLNGFNQKIKRLKRGWDYNGNYSTQKDGYSTITSPTPASLEVTSDITPATSIDHRATYLYTAFRFAGSAGFHFSGTGQFGFTNITSTTVGELRVSSGTVNIYAGGGWIATTNVVIEGTGTLNVNENAGDTAFGSEAGKSECELLIADNGKLNIAANEKATVKYLFLKSETGYKRPMQPGIYGSTTSGVSSPFALNCFTGTGKVQVLRQLGGGLQIFIK